MTGERMTDGSRMEETVPLAGAVAVAAVFAALGGWFVYQAAGNLINVPPYFSALGLTVPWALLVLGVALPVLLWGGALLASRRQALTTRVLVHTAALAATAATYFSVYAASLYQVSA